MDLFWEGVVFLVEATKYLRVGCTVVYKVLGGIISVQGHYTPPIAETTSVLAHLQPEGNSGKVPRTFLCQVVT